MRVRCNAIKQELESKIQSFKDSMKHAKSVDKQIQVKQASVAFNKQIQVKQASVAFNKQIQVKQASVAFNASLFS